MAKKKSKMKISQEKAEATIKHTNEKIDELGEQTSQLYDKLNEIQSLFDVIRNMPSDKKLEYEKLKEIRLNWKDQAKKIEDGYNKAVAKNVGQGAAGVGVGVAVVTMGPTAAMGVATTFGVASTGTAISSLSGAAATNAALAWLGGGALTAGGGGMAAGEAFLALAGPVGWAIAGVALLSSGLMFWKAMSDKNRLERVFTLISERDVKTYELAIVELEERTTRIKDEGEKLKSAIEKTRGYGADYEKMTEGQQYELGAYVNLMSASTQLLVNPILGLQPKYNEEDFEEFSKTRKGQVDVVKERKDLIIAFANLLYKVIVDSKDRKLLWKTFRENKKFLKFVDITKKEFDSSIIDMSVEALKYKDKIRAVSTVQQINV
jgi:hypothetical protein